MKVYLEGFEPQTSKDTLPLDYNGIYIYELENSMTVDRCLSNLY